MKVLVACEESQRVCTEFRKRGHEAFSCDLQPCSGGHPEWHIQDDVLPILDGFCFRTESGSYHFGKTWDLVIAHPPCTYLTVAGAVRLMDGKTHTVKDMARYKKMVEAADFFYQFWNYDKCPVAIENPVPMKIAGLPMYSQIIEPYWFGDPWYKRTCLWLKDLPKLVPSNMVTPTGHWINASSETSEGQSDPKMRSKTFPGIARAMAEQWG